jgi:hypothetical protein
VSDAKQTLASLSTKGTTPEALLERIRALEPADQLRLAAELLEARRPRLALAIVASISCDLEILHMRGLF